MIADDAWVTMNSSSRFHTAKTQSGHDQGFVSPRFT
jgi:hypothetical protein